MVTMTMMNTVIHHIPCILHVSVHFPLATGSRTERIQTMYNTNNARCKRMCVNICYKYSCFYTLHKYTTCNFCMRATGWDYVMGGVSRVLPAIGAFHKSFKKGTRCPATFMSSCFVFCPIVSWMYPCMGNYLHLCPSAYPSTGAIRIYSLALTPLLPRLSVFSYFEQLFHLSTDSRSSHNLI